MSITSQTKQELALKTYKETGDYSATLYNLPIKRRFFSTQENYKEAQRARDAYRKEQRDIWLKKTYRN
ncbi:MAG: hypothetical protein KDH96_09360 [Candidatus Riesia sp.]|nr:hypothetical protein [Candidatus Riesia sp.]